MAIPSYSVNSIPLYGVQSSWERVIKRRNADGSATYQPYAMNILSVAQMEMDTFLSLQSLSGARLTSLATNTIDDANVGVVYTSAEIVEAVNVAQIGRRATSVRIVMRVDVS
jgi:hypothetical protein